jgi:glucose/arabinose dehydrogenase
VGSDSNIADHGLEAEQGRALILAMNLDGSGKRVFASGLRNANGLTIQPGTNQLWAVVNERDMLGNDTPPDYLVAVKDGGFYGWPWSYWGQHVDARVKPPRPDMVQKAIAPDYALGGHVAPLGLAFYTGASFPEPWRSGAYIGEHGSWNRKPPSGYKVAFVTFEHGRPTGLPKDFLTGFLNAKGETHGRPVGVAVDSAGALLVADDVGDIVWRVAAKPAK